VKRCMPTCPAFSDPILLVLHSATDFARDSYDDPGGIRSAAMSRRAVSGHGSCHSVPMSRPSQKRVVECGNTLKRDAGSTPRMDPCGHAVY
jgi:hypothetical protein